VEQRELTIRIRVAGRTRAAETELVEAIRDLLSRIDGEERPTLELATATAEPVAARPTG
jgi:hypothetical protein